MLLGSTSVMAQNGQFDVRFAVKNFDCATNKATIVVQVKAHDAAHTFRMGDANYRFDYDPRVIRNPAIVSQENFSNQAPSSDPNYIAQNLNGSSVGTTIGTVSLNTIYAGGGLGAKLVTTTWQNVACIRFDVQDATKCIVLDWHTDTEFPITGMNEVVLSGQNDGNFDQYIVAAGGVFDNYNQCIPSVCTGIVAIDDINVTNKNTPVTGNAATNDVSSGGAMNFTLLSQTAANGNLTLNPNGTYTYVPATGFVGEHRALYQVCNAAGVCDTASIVITILDDILPNVNNAPVAQNDNAQTVVNQPVTGNVLSNDFDPNRNTLTLTTTPVTSPVNGGVVLNPDGTFTYTPTNGFVGQDTFSYRVCDNGTPSLCDTAMVVVTVGVPKNGGNNTVNLAPNAQDDSQNTLRNTPVIVNVKGNDSDPNGHPLGTPSIITSPANGSVAVNADGTITYTPNNNYVGPDQLRYSVCDNQSPALCDTATVYINVMREANRPPVIVDTPITTPEDSTKVLCITVTDPDLGQTLTPSVCSGYPLHGTVGSPIVTGNQVCIQYTPTANFNGTDTLCLIVCDNGNPSMCDTAKIPVIVTPVNDPPVVTEDPKYVPEDSVVTLCQTITDADANDTHTATLCSQPAHGTASTPVIVGNQVCVTYSPSANYNGTDTVCVIVCDAAGKCDTSKTVITVDPRPDAPVVTEVPKTVPEDSVLTICQTISDPDAGDTHTATLCSQPANGTVSTPVIVGNQVCVTYSPTANFNGTDTVCIIVCDQTGRCDTSKTVITVDPRPDTPIVTEIPKTIGEDSTVIICQTINDADAGDTFTATLCTPPAAGTVSSPIVNGRQVCFTYQPQANFVGNDTICIIVCDQTGRCDTAKTVVTMTPKNDPPVVRDTTISTPNNVPLVVCMPISDPDAGDTHTATLCGSPASGTVGSPLVLNGQVCVQYIPSSTTTGTQTICVRVCDAAGACDDVTLSVTVTASNRPPVANNDINMTRKNTPVNGTVLTNDTDPDNNTLTPSVLTAPRNGQISMLANGTYTYLPNTNFVGTDTVTYRVCDNGVPSLCDTAIVVIEVRDPNAPTNQRPIANDDNTSTPANRPIVIGVKGNDFDPDANQTLGNPTLVGTPVGGTATVNPDGTITFTPTPGFTGPATIQYQVCDSGTPVMCDTATVYVDVYTDPTIVNVAPVANDDAAVTTTTTPVNGNAAANDGDPNAGQILTFMAISNPTKGGVVMNTNGTYTYTATAGQTGLDSFRYKVCDNGTPSLCDTATVLIQINPVNTATNLPPVVNPDAPTTSTGTPINIVVKNNDYDPNGDPLANPTITQQPTCGTASVNADGTIRFVPNAGFAGSCTFIYQVCDLGTPALCDTALVTVNVVNTPIGNRPPVAINDYFVGTSGQILSAKSVAANDSDPDAGQTLTYQQLSLASKGIVIFNSNGTFTYQPFSSFTVGKDSFQYRVCDNGTPVLCTTAWAVVEYAAAPVGNVAPNANDDVTTTSGTTPLTINVRANDGDLNGNPLSNPTIVTPPTCGTATVNADGTVSFVANAGFVGVCTFKYAVCDNGTPSLCDTATVSVNVTTPVPVANRAPIAMDDATTTGQNQGVVGDVSPNDSDLDAGQTLTFSKISNPANGTVQFDADGGYKYIPNPSFVGRDSFRYQVCDNGTPVLCSQAWAVIVVTPTGTNQNDAPIALDDQVTTQRGTPIVIAVKANDIDPDGAPNTLGNPSIVGTPTGGTATVNPDGTVTFTPTPGFTGTATFQYEVCDNGSPSRCDTATVTVNVIVPPVNNVNLPPVAIDDAKTGVKNTPLVSTVASNDSDPNAGQTLSYTLVSGPANGTLTNLNATSGAFTYTPNNNYIGNDFFVYSICDNGTPAMCDTAVVYLTILDDPCVNIQIKALLEGPYSVATGRMSTILNQRGLLPGQTPIGQFAVRTPQGHPYKGAPWNYAGTEGDTITTYPATVVDWVLISLRTNASDLVPAWRCAAWLHADGTITIPNKPCIKMPNGNYFIVIEHRNHMGVMSPTTVAITNSTLNFDFTSGDSYVVTNPPSFGAKAMSNGKWVMYTGDGKKDTQNTNFDINFNDSQLWKVQSGIFDQYRLGDFNLDADVNFTDQVLWKANNGRYSGVQH
jgi:large repetitive protein